VSDARRPPLLLARPEPIGVVAEVPEGPPLRFTWRRREHRVVRAEGPERIAPEWWRLLAAPAARPALPAGSDPPGLTPCRASGFLPSRPSGFPPPPTPPRKGEGGSGALSRPFPPGGGESAPLAGASGRLPARGVGCATKDIGALAPGRRTRDYYRIEDAAGGRFWVFRDGLYGEDDPPRWFLHGVFG
jgi:protein ImuB